MMQKSKHSKLSLLKRVAILGIIILKLFFALVIFGLGSLSLLSWIGIPKSIGSLIASQVSILLFGISMYDFKKNAILTELKNKITGEVVFRALRVTVFVLLFNVLLGLFIDTSGETSDTVDTLVNQASLVYAIILPILVAPLFEELAFRGGLKYTLVDKYSFSKVSYVITSAVIFGVLHYQPGMLGLIHILLTGGMGLIYAIVYLKYNNIYIPMISHLVYNGLVMILALKAN